MSSHDESAGKLNLLVAYPYATPPVLSLIQQHQHTTRFVLDSGAFTAWKAGKPIALDDYCRFIERLPVKPWRYFTLDVIGDPHGSLKNYDLMLRRGFNPVPIFTRGEDPSVLEDYYKTSDVVGIGGLVGTQGNKGFVNGIMRHVAGRRVHWLGFTSLPFIKQYRPYMCDSSSWEGGARFALLRLYMGGGVARVITKAQFQARPDERVLARIRHLGIDPFALAQNASWSGGNSLSRSLGAASGVSLSRDIENSTGTKYFLASATIDGLRLIFPHYLRQTNQQQRKEAA